MSQQKPAGIDERYKGNWYGALVQYPGRIAPIADREWNYQNLMRMARGSGAKVLQEYVEINDLGLEILLFTATHMNRGVNFRDLSKLLS